MRGAVTSVVLTMPGLFIECWTWCVVSWSEDEDRHWVSVALLPVNDVREVVGAESLEVAHGSAVRAEALVAYLAVGDVLAICIPCEYASFNEALEAAHLGVSLSAVPSLCAG